MSNVYHFNSFRQPPVTVHRWPNVDEKLTLSEVERRALVCECQQAAQELQNKLQELADVPDSDDWRRDAVGEMRDVVMGVNAGLCQQKDSI